MRAYGRARVRSREWVFDDEIAVSEATCDGARREPSLAWRGLHAGQTRVLVRWQGRSMEGRPGGSLRPPAGMAARERPLAWRPGSGLAFMQCRCLEGGTLATPPASRGEDCTRVRGQSRQSQGEALVSQPGPPSK